MITAKTVLATAECQSTKGIESLATDTIKEGVLLGTDANLITDVSYVVNLVMEPIIAEEAWEGFNISK